MFPSIETIQEIMVSHPDINKFKKLISSMNSSDINHKIKKLNGRTLLHLAAEAGEFEMINALLIKKADVDVRDDRNYTPMDLLNQQLENNISIQLNDELRLKYRTSLDILEYVSKVENKVENNL